MNSDELLKRWAATWSKFREDEITSVEFEHEAGWTNESGTSWPDETTAIVRAGRRKDEKYVENDIALLLREIMEVA